MVELLSPVGDFECLKAAVQNGADAVYFGASSFSARAFAPNFNDDDLKEAITYAKLRGVKTHLTLNTLLKNDELTEAIDLAQKAYAYGIDAIIVQDLGFARYLIKHFPDLAVHASTQLSVHNLDGVLKLQELGFSRVVLSRELSLNEIEYICKNSNIEIEAFVHGALCISYSGQCLFSSMIGGRSGNRGKCAQPCRLPYELISEQNKSNISIIDKGYLLSPRDLCGLEYLPQLVKSGVTCLKIEGRMKTPEYVATVTRIYRKYLDIALSCSSNLYKVEKQDKQDLLQVFNRGGFSTGHLENTPNRNLIYPEKSNNMGIFLGTISNFNNNKGHITFTTKNTLNVGDKIAIENNRHEMSTYTVSELMIKGKNIPQASDGDTVKIGRMKGKIFVGNKIYKMSDKYLTNMALESINQENRKINLFAKLLVKKDTPISLTIWDENGISITSVSDLIPEAATNSPITEERLISQISKTNNTPFHFKNIEVDLDNGLFIKGISNINNLRRHVLAEYEQTLVKSFRRNIDNLSSENISIKDCNKNSFKSKTISLLLNLINTSFDYTDLKNVDKIYIPFKYFILNNFADTLSNITRKFDTYIYLPTIIKENYTKLILANLPSILKTYKIKGFVVSNIGQFKLLKNYSSYNFICNYTFNIFNNLTINELPCSTVTLSPELNLMDLQNILTTSLSCPKNCELIVYGNIPLMNSNYCLLGKTNKCYSSCKHLCNSLSILPNGHNRFYLKDRLGFLFRIVPDNIDTVTTIYNSKITSLEHKNINVDSVRVDALDENIEELNRIISIAKSGRKAENPGKNRRHYIVSPIFPGIFCFFLL